MIQIDWSKAPEGFDFHLKGKGKRDTGKFYKATSDRFLSEKGSYVLYRDMGEVVDLFHINTRPPAIERSGEGLPPVGTVCELKKRVLFTGAHDSKWFEEGDQVEVGGHSLFSGAEGAVCSVCVVGQNYTGTIIHEVLRPIRTPEQIAAEERANEVRRVLDAMPHDVISGHTGAIVEWMLSDGYRKFEIVEGER